MDHPISCISWSIGWRSSWADSSRHEQRKTAQSMSGRRSSQRTRPLVARSIDGQASAGYPRFFQFDTTDGDTPSNSATCTVPPAFLIGSSVSMPSNLHDSCYSATTFFHESLNDRLHGANYLAGMDIKKESGRRLREAREVKGYTLAEVSERVPGLTPSRLSNWEQGTRMVANDFAVKLAAIYDVRAAWIACLDNDKGDPRKLVLDKYFDAADDRGKDTILRAAERESIYGSISDGAAKKAADG